MKTAPSVLLLTLLLGACAPAVMVGAPSATSAATTAVRAPGALVRAVRPSGTEAPSPAMVSAADRRAAEAGLAMLAQGGSAFDAAAATLLALSVVEPQSSGIGGGGLLVYQPAGQADPVTFDGRETAPAAATLTMFLGPDGKPISPAIAIPGGKSVGVPGNVAMLAAAHAKYGKLPWAKLFAPAIALARDGYDVTPRLFNAITSKSAILARNPAAAALYLQADGTAKPVGTRITNPALAATLESIARAGPKAFYTGPNAAALVATVRNAPTNPSGMVAADLAGYRAKQRAPVCQSYRVYRICGMGPPSSGGVAVVAILKQLERFDLAKLGPNDPVAWHLLAESERLAFADRAMFLADADFVSVPVAGLIDSGYLARRSALISATATMESVSAGDPAGAPPRVAVPSSEVPSTTHFATADAVGNVASLTSTVEGGFGSGLVSGGYVLNNELTDFDFAPAQSGYLVANRVQPGKRPRSSMSPTIVYGPDGAVLLSVGAAGGPTIPAQVAKIIIGVLDWKLPVQAAIDLPVMMVFGDRVIIEAGPQGAPLAAMTPALQALGHNQVLVTTLPYKANALERIPGGWRGGADPRSEGVALGL